MKGRNTGMPKQKIWDNFYNAECIVRKMIPESVNGDILDIGCGYGTFSIPASKVFIKNKIIGYDIDHAKIDKLNRTSTKNLEFRCEDILDRGIDEKLVGHIMIFNFLHIESPVKLLTSCYNSLSEKGCISIIHWKSDPSTPRGPSLDIRPTIDSCIKWGKNSGFKKYTIINLSSCCNYHYGLRLYKK